MLKLTTVQLINMTIDSIKEEKDEIETSDLVKELINIRNKYGRRMETFLRDNS